MAGGHLAQPILDFLDTKVLGVDAGEKDDIDDMIVAMYRQQHEESMREWDKGKNPVTAHSATKCYLQNWFQHNQFPAEPMAPRVKANFRMGGIVETELLYWALLAGEECTNIQDKRHVTLGGWRSASYIDWIHKSKVDGKRRVCDSKSMSNFAFMKLFDWKKPMDDGFGYIGQGNIYMQEWGEAGLIDEPWEIIFLCFKKDTGHIDEYIVPFNPHKVEEAHENSRIIQSHTVYRDCECVSARDLNPKVECETCFGRKIVVDVGAADGDVPPRPNGMIPKTKKVKDSKEYVLDIACSYCPFKWSCWTKPDRRVKVEQNDNNVPVPIISDAEQRIFLEYDSKGKPQFCVRRKK
jgi:hypothetical protein